MSPVVPEAVEQGGGEGLEQDTALPQHHISTVPSCLLNLQLLVAESAVLLHMLDILRVMLVMLVMLDILSVLQLRESIELTKQSNKTRF